MITPAALGPSRNAACSRLASPHETARTIIKTEPASLVIGQGVTVRPRQSGAGTDAALHATMCDHYGFTFSPLCPSQLRVGCGDSGDGSTGGAGTASASGTSGGSASGWGEVTAR